TPPPPRSRRRRRRVLTEWVIALAFAVVLATGLRAFVFEVFFVPTTSMVPTLAAYDRILVQKAFFSWHDVRQGDILVFRSPPGEASRCGGPPVPHATASSPFRVPAGDFYMMGDNRAISCDSRYWGPIKGTSIVGRVIVLI